MARTNGRKVPRAVLLSIIILLFLFSSLSYLPHKTVQTQKDSLAEIERAFSRQGIPTTSLGKVSERSAIGTGQEIMVKKDVVSIFTFQSSEDANRKAQEIKPDGYTIGNIIYDWIDAPHFFKKDNMIIMYIGHDRDIVSTLRIMYGSEFAGLKQ